MFQIAKDIELKRFIAALEEGFDFHIDPKDSKKLNKALCLAIFHAFISKKRTAIVYPDNFPIKDLRESIATYALNEFCLDASSTRVKDNDYSIFYKANIPSKRIPDESLELINQDFNNQLERLSTDYESLLKKSNLNYSLSEMVEFYNRDFSHSAIVEISALMQKHPSFDFNTLFENLSRAQSFHDEQHIAFDNFIDLEKLKDLEINDPKDVLTKIKEQIIQAELLTKKINELTDSIHREIYDNSFITLERIIEQVVVLKEQFLLQVKKESDKKSFFNRKQKQVDPAIDFKIQLEKIKTQISEDDVLSRMIDIDIFEAIPTTNGLQSLQNHLSGITIDSRVIYAMIDRTNSVITNANSTEDRTELESVVKKYNQESILLDKQNTGGFTLNHRKKALANDLLKLKKSYLTILKNPSFLRWSDFTTGLDSLTSSILNVLKFEPKSNWRTFIQSAFIDFTLKSSNPLFKKLNAKRFEQLFRLQRLSEEEQIKISNNLLASERESLRLRHSKENKAFSKKIHQLKLDPEALHREVKDMLTEVNQYYPSLLINFNDYEVYKDQLSESFDLIIDLSNSQIEASPSYQLVGSNKVQIDSDIFDQEPEKLNIPLVIPYPKAIQVDQIQQTIALNWAREISLNILALKSDYKVFQTKNLAIVSFWSDHKEDLLQKISEDGSIKEISFQAENGMVECLIDQNKQKVFLFEDGLINPAYPKLYHWQFYLIQLLKMAQVSCYNIWSSDYYNNGQQLIHSIAEELNILKKIERESNQNESSGLVTVDN